ncbi:MAG TPA: oxygenase MpaB family protein [Terracidiphilus sp.]|nr:oxygenase MpaB family protein [Terracidiphilus sp.]
MESQRNQDFGQPVGKSSFEALLAAAAARAANPATGIFGPESMSWRVNRESALFLAAGRAALLQLAHPWVAASLAEHSSLMDRPIERFHNTFRVVFTMIFGTLPQALAAARHLYALHTRIEGKMPEDVARWARGTNYQANEIGALRWVFATLVESAVLAHDFVLPALSEADRESYYSDSKMLAGLFGLPAASLPENWEAFCAYNRKMHASDELGVSAAARKMGHNLLGGAGSWVRPPFWYRALTIEALPERFREEFELVFGAKEQRAAMRARRILPKAYKRLPARLRFVGPWHEAQARLTGRPAGPLTQWSNQFWIGRSLLPFA